MKITFISFYFLNSGLRFLSSYLKACGHTVNLVFLPPDNMYKIDETYPLGVFSDLKDICRDSDLIGLSVLTNDYFRAIKVTSFLKSDLKSPVIWGGMHSTIAPEGCAREADYVYIGEGEKGVAELAKRLEANESIDDMQNLGFWRQERFIQNTVRPLLRNEELSYFQDFDLNTQYIKNKDRIVKVTPEIVEDNFYHDFEDNAPVYMAIFSRGCVHGCTYCCNNKLNKLYSFEKNIYRSKSVDSMMAELKSILIKFPFIRFIYINDDNFMANSVEFIEIFSRQYQQQIKIPLKVLGSPYYITERKISLLKEAGLREVHVGVQSGSERVNKNIYKRRISKDSVIAAVNIVAKQKIRGRFDFIFDNPYENTSDLLETARLILNLPKLYILQPFSLTFYPGTELYEQAKKDGHLFNERLQVYEKRGNGFFAQDISYLKLVCILLPRMPRLLGKILISKPFVLIFHHSKLYGVYAYLYKIILFIKESLKISVKTMYKNNERV